MTHVSYRNGALLDVEPIVRLAHERGALVLLDAYQSAGSVPIDVRSLGVDFLAAGTVKYLLGSAGLAFLYARRETLGAIWPTATGWFADRDIFEMDVSDYSPARDARRFQYGTPPIPSIYAGIAGIELLRSIGVEDTRAHVKDLNHRLLDGLADLRATVATAQARAPRRARLRPLARRRRSSTRCGARGSSPRRAPGTCVSPRTRTTPWRTSTSSSRRSRATAAARIAGLDFIARVR